MLSAAMKFSGIRIVLVEPKYGGNIGSVARVMKNFGFEKLVLVAPRGERDASAREMAYGSHDILRRAELVDTLGDATRGSSRIIGTSGRAGRYAGDYLTPEAMAALLRSLERVPRAALVFGPEDRGLRAAELDRCDWVVRVPTEPSRASINLSHAVAVVTYAVRSAYTSKEAAEPAASIEARKALLQHAERMLRLAGFLNRDDPRRLPLKLARLLARASLTRREVATFHAILDHLESSLRSRS